MNPNKIIELKSSIIDLKNSLEAPNNRFKLTGVTNEHQDRSIEITQSEEQKF